MGFQSVPDTVLVTVGFDGPNGVTPSFGLYCFNDDAPWDVAQMTTLAQAVEASVIGDYMPVVSSGFTFSRLTVRDLEAQFGRVHEEPVVPTVGGVASPALPANCAVRATFYGEPGSAPARGGINLLPPAESQAVGSLLEAAAQTALQSAVEDMAAAVETGVFEHVIVSRYSGTLVTTSTSGKKFREPIKRAGAAVTNHVDSIIVRSRIDSQRKRLPVEA